jgi:hypothetical protein
MSLSNYVAASQDPAEREIAPICLSGMEKRRKGFPPELG